MFQRPFSLAKGSSFFCYCFALVSSYGVTFSIHMFIHPSILLQDCLQPFREGGFIEMDGRPLCSQDYHKRQGTLCGSCGAPITGRCIAAMGTKFHPEHFVCAFCLRQLSQGVFQEQDGKPYCKGCHAKLFLAK